jgi:hypothetical protein
VTEAEWIAHRRREREMYEQHPPMELYEGLDTPERADAGAVVTARVNGTGHLTYWHAGGVRGGTFTVSQVSEGFEAQIHGFLLSHEASKVGGG